MRGIPCDGNCAPPLPCPIADPGTAAAFYSSCVRIGFHRITTDRTDSRTLPHRYVHGARAGGRTESAGWLRAVANSRSLRPRGVGSRPLAALDSSRNQLPSQRRKLAGFRRCDSRCQSIIIASRPGRRRRRSRNDSSARPRRPVPFRGCNLSAQGRTTHGLGLGT